MTFLMAQSCKFLRPDGPTNQGSQGQLWYSGHFCEGVRGSLPEPGRHPGSHALNGMQASVPSVLTGISANAGTSVSLFAPLCVMPWSGRWQQGWQPHNQRWRLRRPSKGGGAHQQRLYSICNSCGAWILQNRIGANPICKPWIPTRDEVGDSALWPMPARNPSSSLPPQPPQQTRRSAKLNNSCTTTGMSCQQPCEMQWQEG